MDVNMEMFEKMSKEQMAAMIVALQEGNKEKDKQLEEQKAQLERQKTQLEKQAEEIEALKQREEQQKKEMGELREQITELQKQTTELNKHLETAKTFSDLFNEDRERKDAALKEALATAREASNKVYKLQERLDSLEKGDIGNIIQELAKLREDFQKQNETIAEQNKVIKDLTNEIMEFKKEMTASKMQNELLNKKIDKLAETTKEDGIKTAAYLEGVTALLNNLAGNGNLENVLDNCEKTISASIEAEQTDIYIVAPEKDSNGKKTGNFMLMNKDGVKVDVLDADSMIAKAIQSNKTIIENNAKDIKNIGDKSLSQPNNVLVMPQLLNENAEIYAVAIAKNNPIGFDKRRAEIAMGKNANVHKLLEGAAAVKALEKLAYSNPVTGYPNKAALDEFIINNVEKANVAGKSTSVISLDIDFFKGFNDNYGHDVGDKALRHVLDTIKSQIRDTDIVCHPHGEEMTVILPNCPIEQAAVIAERIRTAVEQTPLIIKQNGETKALDVTVSSGIAEMMPEEGISKEGLLQSFDEIAKVADERLNDGKNAGRNICVYNEEYSATALFERYIRMFGYEVFQNEDGFSISDKFHNNDVVIDGCTAEEAVTYIKENTESTFLTEGQELGFMDKLSKYAEAHNFAVPEINSLQDVLSFVSDVDRGFKPEFKDFVAENRDEINMVTALVNRSDKINFTELTGYEAPVQENIQKEEAVRESKETENSKVIRLSDKEVEYTPETDIFLMDAVYYDKSGNELKMSLDIRPDGDKVVAELYDEKDDEAPSKNPYTRTELEASDIQGIQQYISEVTAKAENCKAFAEPIKEYALKSVEGVMSIQGLSDRDIETKEYRDRPLFQTAVNIAAEFMETGKITETSVEYRKSNTENKDVIVLKDTAGRDNTFILGTAQESGKPYISMVVDSKRKFINNGDDIRKNVSSPELAKFLSEYKGIDLSEKEVEKPKKNVDGHGEH